MRSHAVARTAFLLLAVGMLSSGLTARAGAQPSVEIAGLPHVLAPHLASVFGTTTPRGVDLVFTTDTVMLAIPVRNNTGTVQNGLQLILGGAPGVAFQPPAVGIGALPAGATTLVTVGLVTTNAPMGSLPVQAMLMTSGGPVPDTLWLSVWDLDVRSVNVPSGQYALRMANAFAEHAVAFRAPEVFGGGVPAYFDLQAWRDTITFAEPFPGVHWGEPSWEFLEEPDGELARPLGGIKHCYDVKTRGGVPIPGATITQTVGQWAGACVTDASGRCCLLNVPLGMGRDHVEPPEILSKFYPAASQDNEKVEPTPGYHAVTPIRYPDMPSIAVNTDDSPPENAQGGSTTKTVVAGVGTAVGTAIGDVFAFISIPGAGWGIGIASAIAVAATTAAATVVADPEASDVQYVGEANTPPATLTELTLREIVDVQAQMLPPPPLRTEFTVLNHFTFVRETDANTYTYSDADTVQLPCKVSFSTEGVPGAPLRFGVRPLDEGGQPIPSGGVITQAWFAEPSLQTCTAQLLLQDDGRTPDDVAGDGLYTGFVPPGVTAATARLFVCVTRVGFDSTGVPAAVRYQEVPLAPLLEADRSLHVSGLQMGPARPNPAGAAGSDLAFSLPVDARVSVRVVDAAGRERLRPLDAARLSAGPHAVRLRSAGLEPGVYFVTLRAWTDGAPDQGASLTRRWTVLR